MGTAAQVLGILVGVIAVLTPVVGLIRQTRRRLAELDRCAQERQGLQDQYDALIAQNTRLAKDFDDLRRGERGVLIRHEIDGLTATLRMAIGAVGASVLVPDPSSQPPVFVYLCAQGPAAARVEPHRLPLHKGVTGWVFDKGEARISGDAQKDEHWFGAMDKVTEHVTASLLTIPLWDVARKERIGVVQFVNKLDGTQFSSEDRLTVERRLHELSVKADQFTKSPENFRIFQRVSERKARQDSIMFCDLTASSMLFARVENPIAIRCIKEYLESQTRIAFSHGAMVDKYLGDGIMLRFNLAETDDDETHVMRALAAAQEMIEGFRKLKQAWLNFDLDVGSVYNRISIACGPVFEESLGHPQFRQATVIGKPVIRAQDLCDRATRDKDVVLLDEETRNRIGSQIKVTEIQFLDAARPPFSAFAIDLPVE